VDISFAKGQKPVEFKHPIELRLTPTGDTDSDSVLLHCHFYFRIVDAYCLFETKYCVGSTQSDEKDDWKCEKNTKIERKAAVTKIDHFTSFAILFAPTSSANSCQASLYQYMALGFGVGAVVLIVLVIILSYLRFGRFA